MTHFTDAQVEAAARVYEATLHGWPVGPNWIGYIPPQQAACIDAMKSALSTLPPALGEGWRDKIAEMISEFQTENTPPIEAADAIISLFAFGLTTPDPSSAETG